MCVVAERVTCKTFESTTMTSILVSIFSLVQARSTSFLLKIFATNNLLTQQSSLQNKHSPVLSIEFESRKDPSGLSLRPDIVSVCPDILYRISFLRKSQT